MYKKSLILILLLILIVLRSWNLLIISIIIIVSILLIKKLLIDHKIKNNMIMEKMYCRKSDINNPMGNVLLYTNQDELEYDICKNEDINNNLNFNIYNDSKDLFMRKNNIRPFITMPSKYYPNDIDNFKNNLYYLDNPTCKLNSTNCTYNEDIRYHKNYFLDNEIKTN